MKHQAKRLIRLAGENVEASRIYVIIKDRTINGDLFCLMSAHIQKGPDRCIPLMTTGIEEIRVALLLMSFFK